MVEELLPLEKAVDHHLSGEQGVIYNYNKDFFNTLVKYSFVKTDLNLKEHFFPSLHLSDILDGFSKKNSTLDYFWDVFAKLHTGLDCDNQELSFFCDNVVFYSGFLPEFFNNRLNSPAFYKSMAKKGFHNLHLRDLNNSFFLPMSKNLDKYVSALFFMRNNLFSDSFAGEEKLLFRFIEDAFKDKYED